MATPNFVDVKVGDALPPYVHEKITRTDLVRYAGASGDYNPMHHDELLATSVGMPSVFAHGMLSMGLLSNVLVRWAGPGAIRRFEVQFRAITWPDDKVTCTGTVTAKHEANGEKLVDVDLQCETKPGTRSIIGKATVALPA
jgi:acyl dehydratase